MERCNPWVLQYCLDHANGWIIKNLINHHNSVIPTDLIAGDDDIRIGEKLLTAIVHEPVRIRETENGYVCER